MFLSKKVNQIQNNILNFLQRKLNTIKLMTKVGVTMVLLVILSWGSISCIMDIVYFLVGALFICYFMLFGYKHLL